MFKLVAVCLYLMPALVFSSTLHQGYYQQERSITGFSQPFHSKGRYCIKDNLIIWIQTSPYHQVTKIDHDHITVDDKPVKKAAWYGSAYNIMIAVLRQDTVRLEQIFTITSEANHSQQVLIPKSQPVNKVYQSIILFSKNRVLEQVIFKQVNQDVMSIKLSPSSDVQCN